MIKLLVLDVDGTLTDGKVHIGNQGELFKSFHAKDGLGILHILPELGITPLIITGRTSEIVGRRAEELKITHFFQGIEHKLVCLEEFCKETKIPLEEVAYMGDDLNDLEVMKRVALKACPFDAVEEVKEISDFIATKKGGEGAVREFIDWMKRRSL